MRKRALHHDEIVPALRAALASRTALEWEALLADAVPCAAVRSVEEMFDFPQVIAEDMVSGFEHATLGRYRGVSRSIKFGRTPGPEPFAAPALGQHNELVSSSWVSRSRE